MSLDYMRLLTHFVYLTALAVCTGCGSLVEHAFPPSKNTMYIGTRTDCRLIAHKEAGDSIMVPVGLCVDLPFTMVADTLFFPFDAVETSELSRPDPLIGWKYHEFPIGGRMGYVFNPLDKKIVDDYQDYIKRKNLTSATPISGYYEDGKGRRAVEFQALVAGNESWHFVLIYNQHNKRVKVVKYGRARSMC